MIQFQLFNESETANKKFILGFNKDLKDQRSLISTDLSDILTEDASWHALEYDSDNKEFKTISIDITEDLEGDDQYIAACQLYVAYQGKITKF